MDEELTSTEAAELLNVSRAYLDGLLAAGAVAYREVDGHPMINAAELREYKFADDRMRRQAADELSALTQGWT